MQSRVEIGHSAALRRARSAQRATLEERLQDEAHFFRTLVDSPGRTGAVSPSGRFLARAMARAVDPRAPGMVVELGPGTGPVTEALIARGIAPERLVLVEFASPFCRLLHRRFPRTRIVQGDAYRLRETLSDVLDGPVSAIVSSLPLLNKPDVERRELLDQAFGLMGPAGVFVQFTYGIGSPIPLRGRGHSAYRGESGKPVWLNLPPARVWTYRRADMPEHVVEDSADVLQLFPARVEKPMPPALAFLRKLADGGRPARR